MYICPICGTETKQDVCPKCAYDLKNDPFLNDAGILETSFKRKEYENKIKIMKEIYQRNFEAVDQENLAEKLYQLGYNHYCIDWQNFEKHDLLKAREYFEQAAKLNHLKAINTLGSMYQSGIGVDKDHVKAVTYYQQTALQNDLIGINSLECMYRYGFGVEKDLEKADELARLFMKLAAKK